MPNAIQREHLLTVLSSLLLSREFEKTKVAWERQPQKRNTSGLSTAVPGLLHSQFSGAPEAKYLVDYLMVTLEKFCFYITLIIPSEMFLNKYIGCLLFHKDYSPARRY